MTTDDLFVEMGDTPAHLEGRGFLIYQCAFCGSLLASTYGNLQGERDTSGLGACSACGHREWWPQRLPVGPFKRMVRIARRRRAKGHAE